VLDARGRARVHAQLDAALGDQLHALPQLRSERERFAEERFHGVATIDVGVIETGDAQIEALLDPPQPFLRRPVPRGHTPDPGDDGREHVCEWCRGV